MCRLDPNPGRRGKQFERICQWFLTHDPLYAHELRKVWLWDEWPGRWGADAGIDIVAEDRGGHLWAIQAKAYDEATTVTRRDVDTFLAESGRPDFSFRLLIATTNRIGQTARRTIEGQEKQASLLLLGDLEAAAVDWPASPSQLQLHPGRLAPKRPRSYQREAIDKVMNGFRETDRGQLIMACGTGKTLTSLFVNEEVAAERTLVLLPSLSLLSQTLSEWTANSAVEFDFLPVCSDKTVAALDTVVATTSDLGIPVTTAPDEIATFLREGSGPRVIFATYQSSPEIAKAFGVGSVPSFDLVIADEAHRCAGRTSSGFATVLNNDAIPAQRRLFMTATPRYFTGRIRHEAREADFEIASMDDEAVFGPVFHRLDFAESIKRGLLTDYRVVVVGVDDANYLEWARGGRFVTVDGTTVTDARTLAGQIGLIKAMRRYDLRRTITFHSRVRRAREFARSLPEMISWLPVSERPEGNMLVDYASGEMPTGRRHTLLQRLSKLNDNERGLLANVRCLAEGVDLPSLDSVAFVDPRQSEVDIVQAVGRAIRLATDKTIGTIVIPVFVTSDEDPIAALDNSAFKTVWDVVKALRSHDDELGEELDGLRQQLARSGQSLYRPKKLVIDLPERVGDDFARAFDVRLVEQTTANWEFWFGLLTQFVDQHGDACVPHSYRVGNHRLGTWVSKQRSRQSAGTLDTAREQRLQSLPGWTWAPRTDSWEEGLAQLLEYVEHHSSARVAAAYITASGYPLGPWVNAQRTNRVKGRLDAAREHRLEAVAGWSWNALADQWEEGFGRLLQYVEQHGDARVPPSFTVDGFRLGLFVSNKRHFYARGTLDSDRAHRLEALPGWAWSPRTDAWEEGFVRLLEYVDLHGDARVPASYMIEDYRLGIWVSAQRGKHAENALSADREHRLRDLPGWTWGPVTELWEEGFSRLLEYIERHGDTRVPASYTIEGYQLGSWVSRQRSVYAMGTLDADRARRIECLDGWAWDLKAAQWEEGFTCLLGYVERHGNARVPAASLFEGYRLGSWINGQRTRRAKGTLEAERERRLEALTGWTWDARATQWEEGFSHLLVYVERHGDARVPSSYAIDGFQLRSWVGTQRTNHAKGTLDADRARRLQALPGWTWDLKVDQWETGYARLLAYVERHGDARVLQSYQVDGFQLGPWVATQRTNRVKGTLDADRERRLQALPGWTWDGRIDRWEEFFSKLLDYVGYHRHARVPYLYKVDGYQLGAWVATQRAKYVSGTIDADRRRRLDTLPGWSWSARNDQWEEGFGHLLDYVERHGDPQVPPTFEFDGFRLGAWVAKQRSMQANGALDADRERRLMVISGWTWKGQR